MKTKEIIPGVTAKGVWKTEKMLIKLKDTPLSRRGVELSDTSGKPMTIRSIKFSKIFGENNKFVLELEKLVTE